MLLRKSSHFFTWDVFGEELIERLNARLGIFGVTGNGGHREWLNYATQPTAQIDRSTRKFESSRFMSMSKAFLFV